MDERLKTMNETSLASNEALRTGVETAMTAIRQDTGRQIETLRTNVDERLKNMSETSLASNEALRTGVETAMTAIRQDTGRQIETLRTNVDERLKSMNELQLRSSESLRGSVEKQLGDLRTDTGKQLDAMRLTVDEKLQKTLDERISQSFKLVNERLEQVYKGLGEMQTLASGVGDLKKVLSGVKTRGILGEIQLGAILDEILSPEQYATNVVTRKNSGLPVEYAIRLPGQQDGESVWLPIDAKFPADGYARLLEAYDSADPILVKEAQSHLRQSMRGFARDIRDKYVSPPDTTEFGILFLPVEGMYAECVRMGLVEELQREFRVTLAGPTTMAALLNSLQMGFRTLAIQKRSGEVWKVLGAVRTEFDKFGDVLEAAQKRLEQASGELDKLVGVRTRVIRAKLKSVTELSEEETRQYLDTGSDGN
ncbi:MAG: DNA recombination protein RmuC [Ruminococcaceae bacterium]|nr:DNA recombination protein RmuC [Oscillospiraceae bacterium]